MEQPRNKAVIKELFGACLVNRVIASAHSEKVQRQAAENFIPRARHKLRSKLSSQQIDARTSTTRMLCIEWIYFATTLENSSDAILLCVLFIVSALSFSLVVVVHWQSMHVLSPLARSVCLRKWTSSHNSILGHGWCLRIIKYCNRIGCFRIHCSPLET
jgi:hypothetical protein